MKSFIIALALTGTAAYATPGEDLKACIVWMDTDQGYQIKHGCEGNEIQSIKPPQAHYRFQTLNEELSRLRAKNYKIRGCSQYKDDLVCVLGMAEEH